MQIFHGLKGKYYLNLSRKIPISPSKRAMLMKTKGIRDDKWRRILEASKV